MINILNNIKTHKVEVQVNGPFLNTFLIHIYKLKINISNIKYINENTLIFTTDQKNVKKIQKEFKSYKVKIKKEKGIYKIKPFIIKNRLFLFCVLIGVFIFIFLSNIIVDVNVIHSDKKIRELVTEELEERGVKRLTFKKNYDKLQNIRNEILEKYPDKLEWLEIKNIGMTYEVRVEERIITDIKKNDGLCNIIASKSGVLTKIINKEGLNYKNVGDYVEKGDIVIGGDIKVEEEIKKSVCALGNVYAEVWYTVNVSVPLNYEKVTYTGKKRNNFMIENSKEKKVLLKSRFGSKKVKNKNLFSLFGNTLYIQTEYEITKEPRKYNEKQALNKALRLSKEKINLKLHDKERIITQKVLNNEVKNSKMIVEVFVSVEENIGKTQHYTKTEEQNTELR